MAIVKVNRPVQNFFIASRLARIKPFSCPIAGLLKLKPDPKIKIQGVTIWAASWGKDYRMLDRTMRVLCYCLRNMTVDRIIHFSRTAPNFKDCPWETIIIPELDMRSWNVFVNRVVPHYIRSEFAMSVHEDGFPIDFCLWQHEFLNYDYIGAPWLDGTVGNGGFNIESRKMLRSKLELEVTAEELVEASDTHICVKRRKELEAKGIRFAPKDLALEFSTETTGHDRKSFGFHGRGFAPNKYREGWAIIEQDERK